MSAHPFGKPRQLLGRRQDSDYVPGWVRLAAVCALATIVSIGAIVVGIDLWSGRP